MDRVQITILLLIFLVESQDIREELVKAGIFKSCLPYIYVQPKNDMGQIIATTFVLREILKNR